jgi:hypothetical protein
MMRRRACCGDLNSAAASPPQCNAASRADRLNRLSHRRARHASEVLRKGVQRIDLLILLKKWNVKSFILLTNFYGVYTYTP